MRFGIRYPLHDADEGQGTGAAAAVADAGDEGAGGEGQPEPRPSEKKFAELREALVPDDDGGEKDTDGGAEPKGDEGKAPAPKAGKPEGDKDADEPKGEKAEKPKADEKPASTLKLALPAREAGNPDAEFELPVAALEEAGVDVKELTERVAQLRKGFLRGRELLPARQELAAERAEFDEMVEGLREDPVAFVTGSIENPELQEQVVERLLEALPDEAFERILRKADALAQDPKERELSRLRREKNARDRTDDAGKRAESRKADLDYAKKVSEQIVDAMSSVDLDEDVQDLFYDASVVALQRHVAQNKIDNLDPSTVPELLEELGVFKAFGASRNGEPKEPKDAGKKKPAADGERAEDPRERDKRRREATTTPGGDGAEAAGGDRPPKGQTHKERMGWIRDRFGLAKKR